MPCRKYFPTKTASIRMRHPDKRWCFNVFTVIACWFVSTSADDPELKRYQLDGYAQGTTYAVTYYASDQVVSKKSIDSVLAVIASSMSLYEPYSLINKVNDGHYALGREVGR